MKPKEIAIGGIFTSLSLIALYLTSILPISKLSILALSTCFVIICVVSTSIKIGSFVYIATSLLSFILIPTPIAITYSLFFGVYGLIKQFIERLRNIIKEIPLKLLFFNISICTIYFLVNSFIGKITLPISPVIIVIGAQLVFLIYDYLLTLVISYYLSKLKRS